ncbi:MAG: YafY family transcriptional regulator [Anaerolineales bacterium]|nr:YafY family transcriptional regulator [Anaerolineales bacterium]
MSTTATRLITLIMTLQRQPNQKAADLAAKLGVSVRTLHRYFGMLDEMGIPIYAERGPYGGFSLVRGYKLPPLVFTPEEAVAIYLGTSLVSEMWGRLYQESAQGALAKLENVLPDEQRNEIAWARRTLVATGMHRADPSAQAPFLEKLRRAAREQRRVDMRYQSTSQAEATQRQVNPYALVHRSGWWYLVGYCRLRNAPRTFRVDRIQSLELLSQTFQPPDDFDIHTYLDSEFADQPVVRAKLRFKAGGASIARSNAAGWDSLEENPDGSVDVVLSAPDLTWLASMTISFATLVTVLEPPELREMVREWAQAVAEQYSLVE